jgi:hypothetical protein
MKPVNVPGAGMICIAVPTGTAQTAGLSGSGVMTIQFRCHQSLTSALESGTTTAESWSVTLQMNPIVRNTSVPM